MTEASCVTMRRGSLYIRRAVCERYFAGLEAVMLLRRGDDLLILPVRHAAAGGFLLKFMNLAGDRVVNAPDFFRAQGIEDHVCRDLSVTWVSRDAALVASGMFAMQA
jgi:hypothetical protein